MHLFDEFTKGLAHSATRREALKRFGLGVGSISVALLGLANKAEAGACKTSGRRCHSNDECCSQLCVFSSNGSVPFNKRGYCR